MAAVVSLVAGRGCEKVCRLTRVRGVKRGGDELPQETQKKDPDLLPKTWEMLCPYTDASTRGTPRVRDAEAPLLPGDAARPTGPSYPKTRGVPRVAAVVLLLSGRACRVR